jgi:hypothetical protein
VPSKTFLAPMTGVEPPGCSKTVLTISQGKEKIVLAILACPFARKGAWPAMCMMISNVFGVIAAENLGCSKVVLEQLSPRDAVAAELSFM